MPIVGGLDIHRKQITFDYLDTMTGEVERGQITPADRAHLRAWLARFAGRDDVAFAMEGCTGWRYVAGELAAAGIAAHVGEPADTAFARGRKRHAKTDKTDSRHLRELLADGRLPECWIPPEQILECRALLETYHDLRREHTAWVQRIHAVFFHQGAPRLGEGALRTDAGPGRAAVGRRRAPVTGRAAADRHRPGHAHRPRCPPGHAPPAAAGTPPATSPARRCSPTRLYGVGPLAALAMTCWLGGAGRFSSSRKAVRFAGLDITVYSSDGKRSPGHLSRQGPEILRWVVYEARQDPRPRLRPRPPLLRPRSRTARTARSPPCRRPARSSARPATSCPSSATTRSPPPEPRRPAVTIPVTPAPGAGKPQPHSSDAGTTAASSCSGRQPAISPAAQGHADGLKRPSGRIPRRRGDTQSIIMSPGAASARGPR